MKKGATIQDIKDILAEIAEQSKASKEELDQLKRENALERKISQEELEELKREDALQRKASKEELEQIKKEDALQRKASKEKLEQLKRENEEETKSLKSEIKELSKAIKKAQNLFTTQWGRLIESLVEGEIINLFKAKGLAVDSLSTRRRGGSNGQAFEFDIIVHNTTEIVIVEVKTTLKVKDVERHIYKLDNAKNWLKEYKNHNIHGAVAFLKADEGSATFAENNGLWVIRATGNSASIINGDNFEPAIF